MTHSDPLELVGEVVAEKYSVESVVGEGGFAIVYRATHQIWNRPVALKVFKALDEVPEQHRDRLLKEFVQEGALLAELSEKSAAIVQARDVGMLKTKKGAVIPYMVLEWLEGRSLEDILADERQRGGMTRSLGQALTLLQPVAQALALAHERGIAHRDVKPANVFVLGDPYATQPAVKLLDFGIAKVVQDVQKMSGGFTKTSGQITSFTPAYGAPEQFSRDYGATGPWTDVFALALIVVELLTGREPLGGDTLTQLAFASVDASKRPTPRTLGATVPESVEGVFQKALAVRPEGRFRTAGEMWTALSAAARGEEWDLGSGRTMFAGDSVPGLQAGNRSTGPMPPSSSFGPAVTGNPAPSMPASKPQAKTALVAGVGVAVVVGVLGVVGFTVLGKGKGQDDGKTAATASVSASAASVVDAAAAVAKPTCAKGMVYISGGKFFMGSPEAPGVPPHETPPHPVKLSPYCIDKYEVTVAQYMECTRGKGCERADGDLATNDWTNIKANHKKTYDPLCNMRDPAARPDHPANCVTWEQAATYCRAMGGALPTEAQWEFAARGLEQHRFPWGDDDNLEGRLNACGSECLAWGKKNDPENFSEGMYKFDDQHVNTAPVGKFPKGASPFGVEDMSGNVFEWVSDVMAPYPERVKGALQEEQVDPKGPRLEKDSERVVRGGGWNSIQLFWLRPTFRWSRPAWYRTHGIGFRCASAAGT